MSKILKEFYVAYWNWLNCGAPDGEPFQRHLGLCTNLELWCMDNNYPEGDLFTELTSQFKSAGLSMGYPFGVLEYKEDRKNETQHLNPLRIKWVKEHCAESKAPLVCNCLYVKKSANAGGRNSWVTIIGYDNDRWTDFDLVCTLTKPTKRQLRKLKRACR